MAYGKCPAKIMGGDADGKCDGARCEWWIPNDTPGGAAGGECAVRKLAKNTEAAAKAAKTGR